MADITVTSEFKLKDSPRFPVYCKYDGQFEPQPAFIALDIENETVTADYNGNIGGGCSSDVFHGRVLHFPINPMSLNTQIAELIDENLGDFQKIIVGSEIVWNGNNYVGRFNEEAQRLIDKFEMEQVLYTHSEISFFDDVYEAMDGSVWLSEGQTLSELGKEIHESLCDDQFWSDDLDSAEAIEDALVDIWENLLCSGYNLPPVEAQILLEQDRFDEEWLDELIDFAYGDDAEWDIEVDLHYSISEFSVKHHADNVESFLTKDYDAATDKSEFLHDQLKKLCRKTKYRPYDAVHLLKDFVDNVECKMVWFGLPE